MRFPLTLVYPSRRSLPPRPRCHRFSERDHSGQSRNEGWKRRAFLAIEPQTGQTSCFGGFVAPAQTIGKRRYKQVDNPDALDLFFWNCDSTRMPAAMHSFYLRKMYQQISWQNPAVSPCLIRRSICRQSGLRPSFWPRAKTALARWKSTYAATRLYAGSIKIVLSDAGHMARVIISPGTKYGHWADDNLPLSPDEWFAGATPGQGSWWPGWDEWVTQFDAGRVPAGEPGSGELPIIENALGSYVRVRLFAS
jgi:hypothetical protein